MSIPPPVPSPDRDQTDDSLREERLKSDSAIVAGRDAVAELADDVLRRARADADAVLLTARDQADERLQNSDAPPDAEAAVARERVVEDAALERERESADDALQLERIETARVLKRLLPVERDQTDKFLHSERIRSDAALANRDDFLGIVSHDLRNLLSAIAMSSAVIARTIDRPQAGTQILSESGRIQRNVARMNRLIGDLIDIVSIDAGRLTVVPVADDLAALADEAVEAFRDSAAVKDIRIDAPAGGPAIAAFDHARMFQVFANLLVNAIKFTPRGGTITVGCEPADDHWVCSVRDTGAGIPETHLQSVFERFSQVNLGHERGLGLGLFISKCIIDAHGGEIKAESDLGHGTCVSFTLPRPAPSRASSAGR
jgi:signal transduction histidine kinase